MFLLSSSVWGLRRSQLPTPPLNRMRAPTKADPCVPSGSGNPQSSHTFILQSGYLLPCCFVDNATVSNLPTSVKAKALSSNLGAAPAPFSSSEYAGEEARSFRLRLRDQLRLRLVLTCHLTMPFLVLCGSLDVRARMPNASPRRPCRPVQISLYVRKKRATYCASACAARYTSWPHPPYSAPKPV